MSASRRVIVGTLLGGCVGFWVAEQLAESYRVSRPVCVRARMRAAARALPTAWR